MAWTTPTAGVTVTNDVVAGAVVNTTSTSTLALLWKPDGASPAARMFGINTKTLNGAFTVGARFTGPAIPASCSSPPYSVQEYLDSDADGRFAFDRIATPQPCAATCVPFQRDAALSAYVYVASRAKIGIACIPSIAHGLEHFYTIYKDVQVTRLPASLGGGFIMFAARYRILEEDAASADDALARSNAGQSIGDIVCFLSADASFTVVRGPFPLISSLDAVVDVDGDETTRQAPGFRFWLGVPSGFFNGGDLYVYYSAQPDVDVSDGPTRGMPYQTDTDTHLAECIESYTGAGGFGTVDDLTARTCVALFRQSTLAALFASAPVEARWDLLDSWPAAELKCPIRVFNIAGIAAYPLEEWVTVGNPAWIVDAAPQSCCFGDMVLFISVQPRLSQLENHVEYERGHYGIWLARALPEGHAVPEEHWTFATFGRDFYTGQGDQITTSYYAGEGYVFKDPDPRLSYTGWSVLTGDGLALEEVTSDDTTCPTWEGFVPWPSGTGNEPQFERALDNAPRPPPKKVNSGVCHACDEARAAAPHMAQVNRVMNLSPAVAVVGPTVGAGTVRSLAAGVRSRIAAPRSITVQLPSTGPSTVARLAFPEGNPHARPRSAGQIHPKAVDSPLPHAALASTTAAAGGATETATESSAS